MKSCKKCTYYNECNMNLQGELKDPINDMAAECEKYAEIENCQDKEQSAETLSELDTLAMGFILGIVKIEDIMKLDFLNRCLVLSLAAIYSLVRTGDLDRNSVPQGKYGIMQLYKQMKGEIFFAEKEQLFWIDRTKKTSTKLTELAKAINNEDVSGYGISLEIIDLLTKQDVYNKMFIKKESNDDFKEKCLQHINKTENLLFLRFGDIPYVDLLFKFYDACDKSRATEIFGQLNDDNLKKVARKNIPLKNDDIKGIVKSYKELLKIK